MESLFHLKNKHCRRSKYIEFWSRGNIIYPFYQGVRDQSGDNWVILFMPFPSEGSDVFDKNVINFLMKLSYF